MNVLQEVLSQLFLIGRYEENFQFDSGRLRLLGPVVWSSSETGRHRQDALVQSNNLLTAVWRPHVLDWWSQHVKNNQLRARFGQPVAKIYQIRSTHGYLCGFQKCKLHIKKQFPELCEWVLSVMFERLFWKLTCLSMILLSWWSANEYSTDSPIEKGIKLNPKI